MLSLKGKAVMASQPAAQSKVQRALCPNNNYGSPVKVCVLSIDSLQPKEEVFYI